MNWSLKSIPATRRCPQHSTQLQALQEHSMVSTNPSQGNAKGKGRATPAATTRCRGRGGQSRASQLTISTLAQPSSTHCAPAQGQEPTSTISDSVKWEKYPYLTNSLISWLLKHPADWAVLFYDKTTNEGASTGRRMSGNSKKAVHAKIAQHLFAEDTIYKDVYAAHTSTEKFPASVNSHLITYRHLFLLFPLLIDCNRVKKKYRTQAAHFWLIGEGVEVIDDHPTYTNLISMYLHSFCLS